MGEANGRFGGKPVNQGLIEAIAAKKAKQQARVARLHHAHQEVLGWMKSHIAPEIREIDDHDAIDILAVMVGHIRLCEARLEKLEKLLEAKQEEAKEPSRIIVP